MTLGFIDEKGCLDENKLKKYVKMQLSLKLTKCDFGREIFVEFIMAEIIYLVNSGKFSDEKLKNRIYNLFKDYKSKCNCSKNDLKIIGISHLNSKYGFEVDLGEKKYECEANYVCDNFIGIFLKKKS